MHLCFSHRLPSGHSSRSRVRAPIALPVVFAIAALALAGCDKKDQPSSAASTSDPAPSSTSEVEPGRPGDKAKSLGDGLVAELGQELGGALKKEFGGVANELAGMVDGRPALGDDEYRRLLLAHADCEIGENGAIDRGCPAVKAMGEAMSGRSYISKLTGGRQALGLELLEHPSPAVRLKATELVGSLFGLGDIYGRVVDFAQKETHPAVLAELLSSIGASAQEDPAVAVLLEKHAGHDAALVRKAVLSAWTRRQNQQVPSFRERAHAMVRSDRSDDVRALGCAELGWTGHAEHLPLFRELLADTSLPEPIRVACMNGLSLMWYDWPHLDNTNEEAYRLTLQMWRATPRSKMDGLRLPSLHHEAHNLARWRANAPWFNPGEVRSALVELVADAAVHWIVRKDALRSIVHLGASHEELTALRGRVKDGPTGTTFVIKDLDDAIATAAAGGNTVVEPGAATPQDPTPDAQPAGGAGAVGVGVAGALAVGAGQVGGEFRVGQAVQILWNDTWYAGAILEVGKGRWKIRYDSYSESWDEWVGPERLKAR